MSDRRHDSRGRGSGSLAKAWLLLWLVAGFAPPLSAADGSRPETSLQVRQLSKPFDTARRAKWLRRPLARHAAYRPSPQLIRQHQLARPGSDLVSPRLWRGPRSRWYGYLAVYPRQVFPSRRRLALGPALDIAGRGLRRPGRSEIRLMRQPPARPEVVVDQLLITPRADGYGDDRLDGVRALGIPVLRDVPPIVVIDDERAKHVPSKVFDPRRKP
jgi:hypothetical protein